MRKYIHGVTIVLLALCAIVPLVFVIMKDKKSDAPIVLPPIVEEKPMMPKTPKDITYTIDGQQYALTNGKVEVPSAPGSASMTTVSVFGEPVYGDLDADGDEDSAVLLVKSGGGSGTFYYAVLAQKTDTTYMSTNALLLGDRIAPQTVEIHDGRAVYNYAVRKENDPMTTAPSIGKSLWIQFDATTGQIGEWVKDFEGEADTAKMNLRMKKWVWVESVDQGEYILPKEKGAFTLTFTDDGRVSVGTDCNTMGGTYAVKGSTLKFDQMMSTLMYCEGSQESMFSAMLTAVTEYRFTNKGTLELQYGGSGVATFR